MTFFSCAELIPVILLFFSLSSTRAIIVPPDFQRVVFERSKECVPASSRSNVFYQTGKTQCPCFFQYGVVSKRNTSPSTMDFMFFTEANYQAYRATGFKDPTPAFTLNYSLENVQARWYNCDTQLYEYLTSQFNLGIPGEFRIIVRGISGLSGEDCDTTALVAFESQPKQCRILIQDRIVGGRDVTSRKLQSIMVNYLSDANGGCTGSLIAPQWVLTAAHCNVSSVSTIFVGGREVQTGAEYLVEQGFAHPGYTPSQKIPSNDIALIKLVQPVANDTQPLKLNSNEGLDSGDGRVAGYGRISDGWGGGKLLQVDLPVVPFDECRSMLESSTQRGARGLSRKLVRKTQLCAGFREGGCGFCQGDSGGPLVQQTSSGEFYQAGIVSGGISCALPNLPGIYTRVSSYADWIQDTTGSSATFLRGAPEEEGSSRRVVVGVTAGALLAIMVVAVSVPIWNERRRHHRESGITAASPADVSPDSGSRKSDGEASSATTVPSMTEN